jgi:hypothetical protein
MILETLEEPPYNDNWDAKFVFSRNDDNQDDRIFISLKTIIDDVDLSTMYSNHDSTLRLHTYKFVERKYPVFKQETVTHISTETLITIRKKAQL